MRTKIIATLGPASVHPDIIYKMALAGADVFRLNFSHGSHERHAETIKAIRALKFEPFNPFALLGDLQGPKIRIGQVADGKTELLRGNLLYLSHGDGMSGPDRLYINYPGLLQDVKPGDRVLLDDGKITLLVIDRMKTELVAEILTGGVLTAKKGVNLPDSLLSLSAITPKDLEDLAFACRHELDWIALSFVRSADDIVQLRKAIRRLGRKWNPGIIAKIEKPEAVENIDEIIEAADALMVARGDLGVELPYEHVPVVQKTIIRKAIPRSKPVIVATQMLEAMISNTRPSRAEINDIANSVMDGADALMLSGETSMGQYPVEAVEAMSKTITETEKFLNVYHRESLSEPSVPGRLISDAVIGAAVELSRKTKARAILTYTLTGYTAIKLASHRPLSKIFIFARSPRILRKMNLVWGIEGFLQKNLKYTDDNLDEMLSLLQRKQQIQAGDTVVKIAGFPMKEKVKSNLLVVTKVKESAAKPST